MNWIKNNIAHYGDMAAIPFFILTLFYFYQIESKTSLEYIIMGCLTIALSFDICSTYCFLKEKK